VGQDKHIFIICTVRDADKAYTDKLNKYVDELERQGNEVHLPHRDTNQRLSGLGICYQNHRAIRDADEVHIFYNPDSKGTHFDMGMAFAMNKTIKVIESTGYGEGKSFARMLHEWQFQSMKDLLGNFFDHIANHKSEDASIKWSDFMNAFNALKRKL